MAGIADKIGKLFGPNSMIRQFFVWGVLSEVASAALTPFIQAITNQANKVSPNVPASPAELASMVLRGVAGEDWAEGEARKSGIHPNIFKLLVQISGGPPSLEDMLHLMRQGKVSKDDVIRAIKQSNIKSEWIDTILKLGVQPPSPVEMLRAYLQGQVTGEKALELYTRLGGDPEYFQLLYDTEGNSPTPLQAADMAFRGVIPWTGSGAGVVSFEQAFLEGPWRNKWLPAFRDSAYYIPEPRTIQAMLNEGSITPDKARKLLQQQAVPADMIDAFMFDASSTKVKAAKELTESTISTLYQEKAIDRAQATKFLGLLRYSVDEINYVLTAWDMARELKYRNTAISTVHSQYISHKLARGPASMALDRLGVPAPQRDAMLKLWDEEESAKVTLLTATQVKSAFKKDLFSPEEALQRLLDLGYSVDDAGIFLSI